MSTNFAGMFLNPVLAHPMIAIGGFNFAIASFGVAYLAAGIAFLLLIFASGRKAKTVALERGNAPSADGPLRHRHRPQIQHSRRRGCLRIIWKAYETTRKKAGLRRL